MPGSPNVAPSLTDLVIGKTGPISGGAGGTGHRTVSGHRRKHLVQGSPALPSKPPSAATSSRGPQSTTMPSRSDHPASLFPLFFPPIFYWCLLLDKPNQQPGHQAGWIGMALEEKTEDTQQSCSFTSLNSTALPLGNHFYPLKIAN
jgi:hypothetical protein